MGKGKEREKGKKERKEMTAPRYGGEERLLQIKGKHSQRQRHLGESRVDMTRLSWPMWEVGES